MAWAIPQFDRGIVDEAGKKLSKLDFPIYTDEGTDALHVINNWRSSHAYPLNTFQITLRNKAKSIENDIIISQRIKRLESIHAKLSRQTSMRMTQMQDIAGCRAVLSDVEHVEYLVKKYKASRFDHKFKNEKNYIAHPKFDGYRCHHLVYEYIGTKNTNHYNGLKIEIQIRTQMQHAWATAVEAVGIFTKQALKSSQGNQDWLRFFSLMGSAIAAIENCNPVPGTPFSKIELAEEIQHLVETLRVKQMLTVYNTTISAIGSAKDAKYFLLILDPEKQQVTVRRYKALQSEQANKDYTNLEGSMKENSDLQIVLVSVESINALRRAYPNYFLDTNSFSDLLSRVLKKQFPKPRQPA